MQEKTYEAQANQCTRTTIIRQFGKYLDSIGVKAYVISKGYYPTAKQYIPYIYTVDELTRFFAETDKCRYCYECPNRHQIMPVIFRMIYICLNSTNNCNTMAFLKMSQLVYNHSQTLSNVLQHEKIRPTDSRTKIPYCSLK